MMKEYHKIETVFNRDVDGTKKLIEGSYRSETVEMLKDVNWIWTEKVDGCLHAQTKLSLPDGGTVSIGDVVRNHKSIEILGFDGENVVPTKIIGWHSNGQTDDWYKIKYKINGFGRGGSYFSTILCTGNHKFYTNGEYKRADELSVGDRVSLVRNKRTLTYQQEQIITGLLIGDGSAAKVTDNRSVEFSQNIDHEGYIDWLLQSLGSVAGNKQGERVSGYGTKMVPARTISCSQIQDFVSSFYNNEGKKIIPRTIKLSPISLAVIYMDDGSLSVSEGQVDRCVIFLNDYDEQSVDNFVSALEEQMDIHPIKFFSKGWCLRFNTIDADKLQMIVSPYICDCMQYKLSERYRGMFIGNLPNGFNETVNTIFESEILEIERKTEVHERYDITTETHNYFANGVLVHNCNIRINWDGHKVTFGGRTDRAQIPVDLMNFLNEKFATNETEELFEQKFGDCEVTLYGEGYGKKIQKVGGLYRDDVSFILFDVTVGNTWLKRDSVEDIATAFGVDAVPIVGVGSIEKAVEFVKQSPMSALSDKAPMEGVVARPECEVFDRMGRRVIVKIKVCDFKE